MKITSKIFFCLILSLLSLSVKSQRSSVLKKFAGLSHPEKCWVIRHPFVAKKTWKISEDIIKVTDSIANVRTLDGDKNGGQVDAFRHAYWMAQLAQNIGWRKALGLGRVHEKANYIDFKKHHLEEGTLPDKASGDMDLYNNSMGVAIGKGNKKSDAKEIQILVIDAILAGKMKIIKKDSLGNFLDCNGNIIPTDSLKGKWENGKWLVDSKSLKPLQNTIH